MATCLSKLGDEDADAVVGFESLQFSDAFYAQTPGDGICLTGFVTESNPHPHATSPAGSGLVLAVENTDSSTLVYEADRVILGSTGQIAGEFESKYRVNQRSPAVAVMIEAPASPPANPASGIAAVGATVPGASYRLLTHP